MPRQTSGELASRVVLVTGASRGIGRAIALEAARAGADVLIHARDRQAAETVAAEVRAVGPAGEVLLADLADPSSHASLVERAWSWQGRVDGWVNNAGVDVLTGPAARWTFEEKLDALWQVDVAATVRLARLAGRRMKAAGAGVILNIGWDGADRGMAGDSGELFSTTKGAVMAFTRSLAQSLAPEVRVNCVAPGWIRTAWGQHASAAWQDRARQECLRGRWGTPEDVAQVVRFLISAQADFITGQVVYANGGFATGPRTS